MKASISVFLLIFTFSLKAQVRSTSAINLGYFSYQNTVINIEPGPNWKGYNLDNEQNGFQFSLGSGISYFRDQVYTGLNLSYLNFEGIHGVAACFDSQVLILNSKLSPLAAFQIGYSHIWNQYERGTGTVTALVLGGLQYKVNESFGVSIKSGYSMTQQVAFVPFLLGCDFKR